ncbi:MAG: aminodeoxychorismate synthase component I [Bacteroidota bacterium]
MSIDAFIARLNTWGAQGVPFLFLVDFELEKPKAWRLHEVDPKELKYDINGFTNAGPDSTRPDNISLAKFPISLVEYQKKFEKVLQHLEYGDSYLTNLTIRTGISLNATLSDLFSVSKAKYKLLVHDRFMVFSPEIFIRIRGGKIYSYPMKGTIDAAIPQAREKILNDQKELSEHVTIVDLIRNDLSGVADNVKVVRFRYIDELKTSDKSLLQVSSEIVGDLPDGYQAHLGDILVKLLPAGSVSGAPKCKTLEIIRQAETEKRGYYTGVFGYFDGKNFDSGVMIRFVEHEGNQFYYRSGGGITTQSILELEYQEAIDKVYVPFD